MATIKKGSYRFNDELIPSIQVSGVAITSTAFDIGFTASVLYNGEDVTLFYDQIALHDSAVNCFMKYRLVSSNPDLSAMGVPYPFMSTAYNDYEWTSEGDLALLFGHKTITITEDTYVDEVFATWFKANTKEVKAISGKRRFKDKLTQMPFEGGVRINFTFNFTDANFETTEVYTETISAFGFSQEPYNDIGGYEGGLFYHYGGSGFDEFKGKCLYSGLTGWHTNYFGQTREEMAQALRSSVPDIDDTTLNYYLDELYKCYGEDIKTVDFATEPQYIPVNAWAWIMENTEPVAVEITYKGEKIELSAGQTATLHIKDHKLTEDLVIKANEVTIPETSDSPLPIEVKSETEMNALLTTAPVGSVYKYTGTSGTYENGALYVVEESE